MAWFKGNKLGKDYLERVDNFFAGLRGSACYSGRRLCSCSRTAVCMAKPTPANNPTADAVVLLVPKAILQLMYTKPAVKKILVPVRIGWLSNACRKMSVSFNALLW